MELIFGVAAIILAGIALWYTITSTNRKSDQEYVQGLERRIGKLEKELSACHERGAQLVAENIELMRQLVGVPVDGD